MKLYAIGRTSISVATAGDWKWSSSFGVWIVTRSGKGLLGPILPWGSQLSIILTLNMSNGRFNIFIDWLTRRNHKSILELYGLCTMCPKLSTNNHLTSLCPTFHDKSQYTISSPPNSETSEKLVSERLGLRNSAKLSVVDFLSVKLYAVLWKLEPFLYHLGQLSNPSSLLTENVLCLCGSDDDLGLHWVTLTSTPE